MLTGSFRRHVGSSRSNQPFVGRQLSGRVWSTSADGLAAARTQLRSSERDVSVTKSGPFFIKNLPHRRAVARWLVAVDDRNLSLAEAECGSRATRPSAAARYRRRVVMSARGVEWVTGHRPSVSSQP